MNKSSDNSGNINCEITTIKRTHWRESATLNLISLYSANEEQFKNPNIKNETVWKNIATQLKEDGFNCNHKQGEFKWKHSDVSISQENYISNKLTTINNMGSKFFRIGKCIYKFFPICLLSVISHHSTVLLPNILLN
jgi:Tfp pilus assembly protein PilX